jgi:hypothetical protein
MDHDPGYEPAPALVAVVHRLSALSTTVASLQREHEEDNDGELLPYLLLADVARWYVDRVEQREEDPSGYAEAVVVVDALGRELADADPDGPVVNGIALGFLEELLPHAGSVVPEHVAVMPAPLRTEIDRMLA